MYYIILKNDVVVYDCKHKPLVKCPTELEAIEYIREHTTS